VDISSYQEALNRLAVRTEELSRSNSDLERFAYVASHDLQEPLSYISRYAGLLLERYDANGDPDARQYLSHISDSAQRLQSMVDDILTYSRLSRQGESFAAVDFGEAADAAASTLEDTFQETHAVLERGPRPTLDADRMQIQQLFRNLFSNSLKFRGENPPTIRVLAREEAGYWRFSVKDNGIGIEPEGINEIFGMFRRLHTSKEYSGTGVGLAICQSIVERHGGKIWAESEPGKGATIYFTIKAGRQSVPLPDADGRLPV
jgi:chemotaxis family two-component system sensor kinase Cph1